VERGRERERERESEREGEGERERKREGKKLRQTEGNGKASVTMVARVSLTNSMWPDSRSASRRDRQFELPNRLTRQLRVLCVSVRKIPSQDAGHG